MKFVFVDRDQTVALEEKDQEIKEQYQQSKGEAPDGEPDQFLVPRRLLLQTPAALKLHQEKIPNPHL
jgi:hypothetical protein